MHNTIDSILLLDIGSVTTRASLIDVVERQYRLVATADYATTAEPPVSDVGEGVRQALDVLSELVGQNFFDEAGQLIVPSRGSGNGVDAVVLALSLQADIRVALVGLLPEISLRSIRKITESAPVRVVAEVSLGDKRSDEARMDALCNAKPDLLLAAGGTEGGASEALLRLMEVVGLSIYVMPQDPKPQVLFLGNSQAAPKVTELLQACASVTVAKNIRPQLETEDLDPGRVALNEMTAQILRARLLGIEEVLSWTAGIMTPSPLGLGTVVQLLGRSAGSRRGVLGVSVGAGSTVLGAAFGQNMELTVRPDLNLGYNAPKLIEQILIRDISRWVPADVSEDYLRDYIHNKTIYPRSIPLTELDLWVDLAIVREMIRAILRTASPSWRIPFTWGWSGVMPPLDTVLGSGAVLGTVPRPGLAALALLDAIQPPGVTRLILDTQSAVCVLGAAARVNPVAVVQVLESPSFPVLCTAISPVGQAHPGNPVMQFRLVHADGRQVVKDVRFGDLHVEPLPPGQKANLTVQLHRHFDLGAGYGQGGTFAVEGGLLGVVIDARGRPVVLETDAAKAQAQQAAWLSQLGA